MLNHHKRVNRTLLGLLGAAGLACAATNAGAADAGDTPIYENPAYTPAERAADLVARMTVNEKASQMISSRSAAIPRLDIPSYAWWNEALHGPAREGDKNNANPTIFINTTSYPVPLSLSSSWNPALVYQEAGMISSEMREVVQDQSQDLNLYTPVVNLMRDPRWGRSHETFSEDQHLTARLGAQYVDGLEGKNRSGELPDSTNGYLKANATIKHYAANNSEFNRLDGSSNMSERALRDYYTAQFRDIVQLSHPASMMSSYNEVNGVPAAASVKLIDTLARQTYGFDGFFTSDCDAIYTMDSGQKWVPPGQTHPVNYLTRAAFANSAGEDLECQQGYKDQYNYANTIPMALKRNIKTQIDTYNVHDVNVAVARLMAARIRLGGLGFVDQNNVPWIQQAREELNGRQWVNSNANNAFTQTPKRLGMARAVADQGIVLLKNAGPQQAKGAASKLLPLEVPSTGDYRVAVIGSYAKKENMYFGSYSSILKQAGLANVVSPYEGLKNAITAIDPDAEVDYLPNAKGNAAASYNVAIVVAGTNGDYATEGKDRDSLKFPDNQAQLINQVAAQNPHTIVYMVTNGAMNISSFKDKVPAMLWSSYNGMREGDALADVVLGRYNPSGHLPFTWYQSDAQLAPITDYNLAPKDGRPGRTYEFFEGQPDYAFGYGLSYTAFEYSNLRATQGENAAGDPVIEVSAEVTNNGDVAGAAVPQLYVVNPDAAENTVPNKRLRGFQKVSLAPYQSRQVRFSVPVRQLAIFDADTGHQVVSKGRYRIQLASSSADDAIAQQTSVDITRAPEVAPQVVTLQARAASDPAEGVARRILFPSGTIVTPMVTVAMSNQSLYGYIHKGASTPLPDAMQVTYRSNRPDVVAVDSGQITTGNPGVATITATVDYNGHTAKGRLAVDVQQQ